MEDRRRVLVVDDDPHICELYKEELEDEGYDVTVSTDPAEAIRDLPLEHPDVVVMDIWNPKMDGIDAMGRMLAMQNDLPVILNTAYTCYKDDFRTWPAVAYVVKSADLGELKTAIKDALAA